MKKLTSFELMISSYGAIVGLIVAIIIFSFVAPHFFSVENLKTILIQSCVLGICSFGLTCVLMVGEIDLSYGGLIGLIGVLMSAYIEEGASLFKVGLICGSVGAAVGLANGLLIVKLQLPSFLVTLGTMFLCLGCERVYNAGTTIWITNKTVLSILPSSVVFVPIPIIILFVLFLIFWFLQTQTRVGQYIWALGDNLSALKESGVRANMLKVLVFMFAGIVFAFGGSVDALRSTGALMYAGKPLLLPVLAASFLGIAMFKIGKASFGGTLLGVFFLLTLMNGFTLLGVPFYIVPLAQGIVLIGSVVVSSLRRGKIEQVKF